MSVAAAGSARFVTAAPSAAEQAGAERRIVALDGLRGLMTLLVILSHYFGELPNGIKAAMSGWVAVNMFFVLSGLLIGKLILDKQHHGNFFTVFYARRILRLLPAYVLTVVLLDAAIRSIPHDWVDADTVFPLASYLTFTQGFWFVSTGTIGAHWLAPTWTLAVEEHFYMLVPAAIVFTPRRFLVPLLVGAGLAALLLRVAVYGFGFANPMVALVLIVGRADILVCGVLAAILLRREDVPWARLMPWLRGAPIVLLLASAGLKVVSDAAFDILSPLLVALGCAAFLLAIVQGAPEAARFHSRVLRFFGDNGYCLYLTHLPVLGLAHGLILGTRPDLATLPQLGVTLLALPVCILVGWGMTALIEEPLTTYARRRFRWR